MKGMNAQTGRPVYGDEHLLQSVTDILTTPVGTRVLRRDYGSDLFSLIDSPEDGILVANIRTATATAINRWEPRLKIRRVYVLSVGSGNIEVAIEGVNTISGKYFQSGRITIT